MDHERLYCAEQIHIPANLGEVLREYSKAVIREQPENLYEWSASYFAKLANKDLDAIPVDLGTSATTTS